jgi:tRNA dimethylallyltransferase
LIPTPQPPGSGAKSAKAPTFQKSPSSFKISFIYPVKNKTVIIIAGPTAVGKTAVGLAIAEHFRTEIISADSRQCFRELTIGVARPSPEELAKVPHHFIASHSIHQKVTAAVFEEYALAKAAALFQNHDVVVMVGGTGLYIKAFTDGMDPIPGVPPEVHEAVVNDYRQHGMAWLQNEVQRLDPEFYRHGETQNPQRMMRALEVARATGRSILSFRTGEKRQRPFETIRFALELPRELLHQNISHRVDRMIGEGLVDEARSLLPYQHLNALQTVGYKEVFACLNGEVSLQEATAAIKQNTRRYAKRQLTWFRKEEGYRWVEPDAEKIIRTMV